MRTLSVEEVRMVSGGNWLAKEVGKAVVVELVMAGGKSLGRTMWSYAKTAPPQVFHRARAAL